MGLDDLVRCIELLKERMQAHRDVLSENETRTRMALINPLLRALGWDVSDPGIVTPEYNVEGRAADYALLRPKGQAAATIEAKKLGAGLPPHRMQMLNYANAAGISYAGLTDGNHWELYDVFRQAALDERRILQVSIANDPTHESALKLLLLWRPNLASGNPVDAKTPILIQTPPPIPPKPPPPPPNTEEQFSFTFRERKETFTAGSKLIGAVFSLFASMDPDFCRQYSEKYHGRDRKYVAQTKEELYPGKPGRQEAQPLPGGWWLGTHSGSEQKLQRIKEACQLAGLEFGRDLKVEMPVVTRKKRG